MQQFWPFGVGILVVVLVGFCIFVLLLNVQRPNLKAKSPHHRANRAADMREAEERQGGER